MPQGGSRFTHPVNDVLLPAELRKLNSSALSRLVDEGPRLDEEQAIAIFANPHCSAEICTAIAQNSRLTSFYSVRARLVAHRATPLTYSLKFVRHLYWSDLLRMSVDVRIPAPVRRSMDQQLIGRLPKLTTGEKVTTAKSCSRELVGVLLFDPDPHVFEALLINPRLSEETLLRYINSDQALPRQLTIVGDDRKWRFRPAIREALLKSANTPKSVAASQIRHLTPSRLNVILEQEPLSVYLRTCIRRYLDRSENQLL